MWTPSLQKKTRLIDGLPILNGGPDVLRLWLVPHPGDIKLHISAINAPGIRINHKYQPITMHEYVRFWGMCLAARHFSEQGKCLWGIEPLVIRAAPNFDHYMAYWRLKAIRRLVKEICPNSSLDPWLRFHPIVNELYKYANRAKTMHNDGDVTVDESMSGLSTPSGQVW